MKFSIIIATLNNEDTILRNLQSIKNQNYKDYEVIIIDGGSSFTALWRVLVPVSIPGIVATGVYTFLLSWNEFLFALTLTKSTEMRTVPIGIQLLMGQHSYEWNEMMAMSILGSFPILIMYMLAQRYFLEGLTAGSVKN